MQACKVTTQQQRRWNCVPFEGVCLHLPLRTTRQREKNTQRVAPCSLKGWERLSSDVLVLMLLEKCRHLVIIALSNESYTMPAIVRHSMIGDDSNCTNSTIATVACACAAAGVVAAAVVVSVGLQIGVSNTCQFLHCFFNIRMFAFFLPTSRASDPQFLFTK